MDKAIEVSRAQVNFFRLGRLCLSRRANVPDPAYIVSRICGAQAQVMSAAEMSIGTRVEDMTASHVRHALLKERRIIKTWAMRGTLHLLAAEDLPLYISALGHHLKESVASWLDRRGLDHRASDKISEAILDALEAGPLTRKELASGVCGLLGTQATKWIEHSWGGVVKCTAFEGHVCFGPTLGNETTYVRVDKWLRDSSQDSSNPARIRIPQNEASMELIRRYLRAYGPADMRDYCAWSGLRAREAKGPWQALRGELVPVNVDGRNLWLLSEDVDALKATKTEPNIVRLLPNFDSYLLAHRNKDHIVYRDYYKQIYRSAGWIAPVILANGEAIGTWSCRRKRNRIQIELTSFKPLAPGVCNMAKAEAKDLGRFLNTECEVLLA
jgi:hypothetical protein